MAPRRFETAVVTGGASGLGAAIVDVLRSHGARVVVSDIREDALRAFVDERSGDGPEILAHACDVTDPEAMEAMATFAVETLGHVDLWVNNAGVAAAGRCEETDVASWMRVVDVDLMGVVWGCRAILPHLRERDGGAILNVASAAALVCGPQMAAYNTAKKGVMGLSQSLVTELAGTGVTVTCLCPTFFHTNLLDTATGDPTMLKVGEKLMVRSPWTAKQVAGVALNDTLRGRAFSIPMRDGAWVWLLRRWFPQYAGEWIGGIYSRAARRFRSR